MALRQDWSGTAARSGKGKKARELMAADVVLQDWRTITCVAENKSRESGQCVNVIRPGLLLAGGAFLSLAQLDSSGDGYLGRSGRRDGVQKRRPSPASHVGGAPAT